jgi:hypothetical protein
VAACWPLGQHRECVAHLDARLGVAAHAKLPSFFTFVLTVASGQEVYGAALIAYEELPKALVTAGVVAETGTHAHGGVEAER